MVSVPESKSPFCLGFFRQQVLYVADEHNLMSLNSTRLEDAKLK